MATFEAVPGRGQGEAAVQVTVEPAEASLLAHLAGQLLDLVTPTEPGGGDDPLAAMVGIGPAASRPDDPVLARLLPDGYGDEEDEAAAEFRRFTEQGLRQRKRSDAEVLRATLAEGGEGPWSLSDEQARAWLGCLNDLRLALGTRLGLTEEEPALDDDDPRWPTYVVYAWLGQVQQDLVECLTPRPPQPGRHP